MIPIFITNRNLLTTPRELVKWCMALPGTSVVILDNESTYPPLLEWYDACPVRVVHIGNAAGGERSPWIAFSDGVISLTDHAYFVVTDSDLDMSRVPTDVLDVLRAGLDQYDDVVKTGVSLEIDDIPEGYPRREWIINWESKYWLKKRDSRFWEAPIGGTFCMYRSNRWVFHYEIALRADRPYTARHVPWYQTPGTVTEEEKYYVAHAHKECSTIGRHLKGHPMFKMKAEPPDVIA